MPEYCEIPVHVAKSIAETFQKDQVIILAFDAEHQLTHTTTYGKTAVDKENAAAAGELLSKTLGCDLGKKVEYEDFHRDYDPAIYRESLELLTLIARRGGTTAVQLQAIERLLKLTGRQLRQT